MGKGIIGKASQEGESLRVKGKKEIWTFYSWVGGGLLSYFPFILAIIGFYFLNNTNYKKLIDDYLFGGDFIWIAAVFLIMTMGNSLTYFIYHSKSNTFNKKMIWLFSGVLMFVICIFVFTEIKGHTKPPSLVFSLSIWLLTMFISVGIYKTKET